MILHDGVETWLTNPALTAEQRAEIEKLLPEEKERDRQAATMPANISMKRMQRLTAMDYLPDDLARTLQTIDDQLTGKRQIEKALDDVQGNVNGLRRQVAQTDWEHDQKLGELYQAMRYFAKHQVSADEIEKMIEKMLAEDREAHRPETDVESANKALTKSVASFLPDNATWDDSKRATLWVLNEFGRRGGQSIKYNKELAGRLLLSKSISPQEHENLKKYNRLPYEVTLQSQGRAQAQADQAMLAAHAMASLGIAPLAAAHMLRRR
jgi:hypothetical protein